MVDSLFLLLEGLTPVLSLTRSLENLALEFVKTLEVNTLSSLDL